MLPFNFLLGINKNLKNPFALFVCSAPLLFVLSPLLVHPFPDRVESPPNQPSASEQPKSKNIASLKNIFTLTITINDNHNNNVKWANGNICFLDFEEIGVFAHEVCGGSGRD